MNDQDTIRFARLDDLDILAEHVYVSAEIVRRKLEWDEFIVAERARKIIGFLQLEYLWSLVPYVALIHVFPENRRQGTGTRMLEWLEDHLRKTGHKNLYSSSQADEPEPRAWHRHVGFEECGGIAGINEGTDEIFFRKVL